MGTICHGSPVARAPFDCTGAKSRRVRACAAGGHLLHNAWGVRMQSRVLLFFLKSSLLFTHGLSARAGQRLEWFTCFHISI